MFRQTVVSILAILILAFQAEAGLQCREVFRPTLRVEQSIHDLAQLRVKLDLAQAQGNLSPSLAALKSDYKIKEQEILRYVQESKLMDRKTLINKISSEIAKIQNQSNSGKNNDHEDREKQEWELRQTHIDGRRLVFGKISPGSYVFGGERTTLTKAYGMAATVTTQMVWKKVAEIVKIKNPERYETLPIDPSFIKSDLAPVQGLTYREIALWVEGLNELAKANDPSISQVIEDHVPGSVYRLPSQAEWERVVRNTEEKWNKSCYGITAEEVKKHAWSADDRVTGAQEVATKEPVIVDGHQFYDLYGNVTQLIGEEYRPRLGVGLDPYRPPRENSELMAVGGNINLSGDQFFYSYSYHASDRAAYTFRLVRIFPP